MGGGFSDKKRSVVGSEQGRIFPQDGRNHRVSFELLVKKAPDESPVPSRRVDKIRVERKIPFVKGLHLEALNLRSAGRHVEDGEIQEIDE